MIKQQSHDEAAELALNFFVNITKSLLSKVPDDKLRVYCWAYFTAMQIIGELNKFAMETVNLEKLCQNLGDIYNFVRYILRCGRETHLNATFARSGIVASVADSTCQRQQDQSSGSMITATASDKTSTSMSSIPSSASSSVFSSLKQIVISSEDPNHCNMEDLLKTLKDNDSFNKLSLEISMAACRGYSTGKRQRFLNFMIRYITEIRMSFSKASSEMQTKDNEEDVMAMLKDQVQYYRKEKWEALELDALKRLSRLQLQNQMLGDYVASVIQMATLDPQRHVEDFHYCLTSINPIRPAVEQTLTTSGLSVKNTLSFEVSPRLVAVTISNPFQTIKIGDPLKLQLQFWTLANFQCDKVTMIVTNNNSNINVRSNSSINIDNIVNMEKQQILATVSSDGQTPRTATRVPSSLLPNEEVVLFPNNNINNVNTDGDPFNSPLFTIENAKTLTVPSFCLKKVGKFQIIQFKIHIASTIDCDLILPIRDANLIIIQDAPPIVNISTASECYVIGKKQIVPIYLDIKGILYSGILKLLPIPGNFVDDIQLTPKDFVINEEVENKMITLETEILVNSSKNARVQLLALFEIHGKGKYPIPLEKKLSLDFFHAFTYVADTCIINDPLQEKTFLVQFKLKCNTPGPLVIRQHSLHSPIKGVHFTNSKEIV